MHSPPWILLSWQVSFHITPLHSALISITVFVTVLIEPHWGLCSLLYLLHCAMSSPLYNLIPPWCLVHRRELIDINPLRSCTVIIIPWSEELIVTTKFSPSPQALAEDLKVWLSSILNFLGLHFKVVSESSYVWLPSYFLSCWVQTCKSMHYRISHLERTLGYILSLLLLKMRKQGPRVLIQYYIEKCFQLYFIFAQYFYFLTCLKLNELKSWRMICDSDNDEARKLIIQKSV